MPFSHKNPSYPSVMYYDPKFGQFLGEDPLASDMPAWGSYTFTFDNPIRLVDPAGMRPEEPDDWVLSTTGIIYWDEKVTSHPTTKEGKAYLGDGE